MKPIHYLLILIVAGASTQLRAAPEQSERADPAPHICTTTSRPDCPEALAFFKRFRAAVVADKRDMVASMIRYPLRIEVAGHKGTIKSRVQLLREYDKVFPDAVRCAIKAAKAASVWGNWQGYTVGDGVAWWESDTSSKPRFEIITVNNEGFYKGCNPSE